MNVGTQAGISCCRGRNSAQILWQLVAAVVLAVTMGVVTSPTGAEAQTYRFSSVRVEGNGRVDPSTIVAYTGIESGQAVSAGELNDAYQRIIGSGLFETVELVPSGSVLVVRVSEFPTINRINFEGNRRLDDEALGELIQSTSRRVLDPSQAEADAELIAEAYSVQGRVAARVTPRIIRRSNNRVDLVFEIQEGDTVEVERVSFVGNRVFSDRRLRRVLETKQANFLRAFIRADTFIEDRIRFDQQALRDFYLSRGYVDFRVLDTNVELTRQQDAYFLQVTLEEGQQFRFGEIRTTSQIPEAPAQEFQAATRIRPGDIYSPTLVENAIARMERLAVDKGVNFLRVEPQISRNDRDLTLDVNFVLTRGPRVFVERIDVEGNTTTLDRVVRQQFRTVEGDPFNPREIRESAERIRALGYFETAEVEARQGTSEGQVVIDVDVEEQPTGTLSLVGSYSRNSGFGVLAGLAEDNFLGRGQRLAITASTARDLEAYTLSFTEPYLLGRDLQFNLDLGIQTTDSNFATYDTDRRFFSPGLSFPIGENSRLGVNYSWLSSEMERRANTTVSNTINREINYGSRVSSSVGATYSYDTRRTGLDPNKGVLLQFGVDVGGVGGDNEYTKASAKAIMQTQVLNEEVTLRASFEAGALDWRSANGSRTIDRYLLNPDLIRGFEPGGIGPRDQSNGANDALGGNYFAVARFEAEFPIGIPEEIGIRGGLFYDVGNLWGLDGANTTGGTIVGESGSLRQVIGFSILWDTGFGPLRLNFSNALEKESFDKEQSFDLTIQARF